MRGATAVLSWKQERAHKIGVTLMSRTVTAIFDGEVFRPTEPLDLPADVEYHLTIDTGDTAASEDEYPLLKYLKHAQELDLPSDFAAQHDHYLHGTPKR